VKNFEELLMGSLRNPPKTYRKLRRDDMGER